MTGYGPYLIAGLVVAWVAQLGLSLLQMRRFYKRRTELRQFGRVSVGMAGGRYKGRIYGVIAVNNDDYVVAAEKLSGWTVFANLKPVPGIVGKTLEQLMNSEPQSNIKPKLWAAFKNAAEQFFPVEEINKEEDNQELPDEIG